MLQTLSSKKAASPEVHLSRRLGFWGKKKMATSLFALSFSQFQNICHNQNYSKTITTKYYTAGKQIKHVFLLNQTGNTVLDLTTDGYRKSGEMSENVFPISRLCIHCLLLLLTMQ